jgi:outer membrane protein
MLVDLRQIPGKKRKTVKDGDTLSFGNLMSLLPAKQDQGPVFEDKCVQHHFFILWALFCLALWSGCSFSKEYSAYDIRAEYALRADPVMTSDLPDPAAVITEAQSEALLSEAPLSVDPHTALRVPLTLPRVIEITIANNPDLQQAVARIFQAKALKDLSDAAFWPGLAVYTEYMQGDAPSAYLFKKIDQRQLPGNINFNHPGWFENFESGITLRMNLFNGGRDYLRSRMAGQDIDISSLERQVLINDLMAQGISAFYNVQASRKFIDIARASVASVSQQLGIIQVKYRGGSALKSDVLTLQVRLAQAKEALLESQNRYEMAKAALVHLMGFDPAGESKDLKTASMHADWLMDVPETLKEGIIYAFAHRPELKKIRKQLVKSRIGLDASKAGYLPRVDLMGKYYMDDPHIEYDRDRENWTTAVMLTWELFTGFSTGARIKQADAVVREMLAADRKAALNIAMDVKQAYLMLEEARARHDVAESSIDSARESYRLVTTHYKGGAATITRYLNAELDWNRSRIRTTTSFYNKRKAVAELARAIGMLTNGRMPGAGQQVP